MQVGCLRQVLNYRERVLPPTRGSASFSFWRTARGHSINRVIEEPPNAQS